MSDATAFVLYSAGLVATSVVIGYCLGGTIERRLCAEWRAAAKRRLTGWGESITNHDECLGHLRSCVDQCKEWRDA